MQQVDLTRWTTLIDQIAELRERSVALSSIQFELEGRRGKARADFARLEDRRPRQFGPPPDGLSLRDAQQRVIEANAAWQEASRGTNAGSPGSRRPEAADFDLQWVEARDQLAVLDQEAQRLAERRSVLRQRASELDHVKRRCEEWARAQGLTLPGTATERHSVTLPPPAQSRVFDPLLPTERGMT